MRCLCDVRDGVDRQQKIALHDTAASHTAALCFGILYSVEQPCYIEHCHFNQKINALIFRNKIAFYVCLNV